MLEMHDVIEMHGEIVMFDRTLLHMSRQLREFQPDLKAGKCQQAIFKKLKTISSFHSLHRKHNIKMAIDESKSKSKLNKREDLDARLKKTFECNDWN